MLWTIDADTEQLIEWPGGTPVTTLQLKRIITTQDTVQFVQGGAIVAIGAGQETGRFVAKQVGQYAAGFIIDTGNWALQAGPPPSYVFTYSRNTAPVIALFTPVTPAATPQCPDPVTPPIPQSAALMGEFRWTDAAGYPHNTRPFAVELDNELIDDSAGLLPPPDMLNWNKIIVLTGGSLADSLDAQPTAGVIAYGTLIALTDVTDPLTGALVNGGGLTTWKGYNDPAAVRATGVVVPLDFNAATNPFAWIQKS